MTEATDRALLERWVSERDAESFTELAKRYSGIVYATCRRILGDAVGAEDVAQECFEVLSQSGPRPGDFLGPWLHRVAVTRSLNHVTAERRRKLREQRYASEQARTVEYQWDDVYEYVDEAINALPDNLRLPILAHFFQGQTHDAVAGAIGTSRQTVTYRIGKGIERIRGHLGRRGIPVAAPPLAGMLAAHLAEAATPPAGLAASLSKLALAGPLASGANGLATGVGVTNVIGGVLIMKKVLLAVVVLAVLTAGSLATWRLSDRTPAVDGREFKAEAQAEKMEARTGDITVESAPEPTAVKAAATAPEREPEAVAATPEPPRRWTPPPGNCVVEGRVVRADTGECVTEFEAGYSYNGTSNLATTIQGAKDTMVTVRDPEGRFEFRDLWIGRDVTILARANGLADGIATVSQSPPDSHIKDIVIRLSPGAVVEGIVLDESRAPVAGAEVSTGVIVVEKRGTLPGLAQSARDGTFRLENLPPQTFMVVAHHPDYAPGYANIELDPQRPARVEVVLGHGGTVSGIVTKDGKPLPKQLIRAHCSLTESSAMFRASTRTDGTYVLAGMPAGEANVWAMSRGGKGRGRSLNKTVLVVPGDETVADFDFTTDAGVEGTVFVGDRPEPAKLTFYVETSGGSWEEYRSETDPNGNYRMDALPAGRVTLKAYLLSRMKENRSVAWRETFDVSSGQVTHQDVHVGIGGIISGRVTGIGQEELAQVQVLEGELDIITLDESTMILARTLSAGNAEVEQGTGTFRIQGIQPGTYTLLGVATAGSARNTLERLAHSRFSTTVVQVVESESVSVEMDLQ